MRLDHSIPPPPPPPNEVKRQTWMRGVNLGGWLVLERYITPYLFAVTDCHLRGEYCWYPGQLSAPPSNSPDYKLCDATVRAQCTPVLSLSETEQQLDYPIDEHSLGMAFLNAAHSNQHLQGPPNGRNSPGVANGEAWLNHHFTNFIQESDIAALAATGLTHLRVPLPHWILGHVQDDEPWLVGQRWEALVRLAHWARRYQLQIWPDLHTAPGSQNGFDNSGYARTAITCGGWADDPRHVQRTLEIIDAITLRIATENLTDVITGFGLLNEPFKDCNHQVYASYLYQAKNLVRRNMGNATAIYASDMFLAPTFNDGHFWLDPTEYSNTFLDSHYYHVFDEHPRDLSPRQHIAFTCEHDWRDVTSCCYEDPTHPWYNWKATNTIPSHGVQRMVGEWSAAYDTLVGPKLQDLMRGIRDTGVLPEMDKQFTVPEMDFLRNFVQAQMVAFEAVDDPVPSSGWFYWTAKMEGGALAEWDFLRGVREGWIPEMADLHQPSQDLYGTCYDILFKTADDRDTVVHTFPDPADLPEDRWRGVPITDDVVLSHGLTLLQPDGIHHRQRYHDSGDENESPTHHLLQWLFMLILAAVSVHVVCKCIKRRRKQALYTALPLSPQTTSVVVV